MPNIFKDGGGAGIGSFVVVFKNGQLAPETDLMKLRGAYAAGEQIYFSVIDEETEDALVPASGWIDEEAKLHLVARDFDDSKTYGIELSDAPVASEIVVEAEVKDGIDMGGEEVPSQEAVEEAADAAADAVRPYFDGESLVIPEQAEEAPESVGSVKQGEAIIPLKDERLPAAAAADEGKIIKVNEEGDYELAEDAGTVLPVPAAADEGKIVKVNAQGEYELGEDAGLDQQEVQALIDAAIGDAINASY